MPLSSERVLSIHSHVAFGYVGGKSAIFPLQCLGYDVDVLNTVNFSNHSQYDHFQGTKLQPGELRQILRGMAENQMLNPTRLLTGYVPGGQVLSVISNLAKELKEDNPDLIYLLDPVIGDAGKVYVGADVIPIYRSMLPLATIITPNWFEVEILTGVELVDFHALQRALRVLHEKYLVPNVVISSIPLKRWLIDALPARIRPADDADYLLCVTSLLEKSKDATTSVVHAYAIPVLPGCFHGVGDLFSALTLGHLDDGNLPSAPPGQTSLSRAVALALVKTRGILLLTHEYVQTLPEADRQEPDVEKDKADPLRKSRRLKGCELRIIQGQDIVRGNTQEVGWMHAWDEFWKT